MAYSTELENWFHENNYTFEDINKSGKHGNSAIMKAAREARVDLVNELIALNAFLHLKNVDGNSALWNACFASSYECFEALVIAGIDIDSQNVNGVTALMYCASAGKEDFVELLIQHGANIQLENLDGFKAIDLAVTPKIVKLLKTK